MRVRRWWRTYGPSFRWLRFRMQGEPPNDLFMPAKVVQIIGGRRWSLSIIRHGEFQRVPRPAPRLRVDSTEDADAQP